ncbi:glycosyltransferase [Sphingomonas abaci]|uniref:Glycosyltransferase involved in cell wall biosynthesis n=1 Tax=Sphingomonas abaci TaxID=237611 RepID=A0A7W7AK78_9SPHN|nr:glycosyltransferase [Sphingomonas abaci]MBB4618553.1 glycosyltransferase involved in cell wall biosynthesis [Sphingomonas abaci]
MTTAKPRILLCSPIPVTRHEGGWRTIDLWARDVNAQADQAEIVLLCPIVTDPIEDGAPLDPAIAVVDERHLSGGETLEQKVDWSTAIQLPGNGGLRMARRFRPLLRIAAARGTAVFLGITSNRARTAILNSRGGSWPRRIQGLLRYADVRLAQNWLARRCAGVFVVGEGVRALVEPVARSVHVGVASWIQVADIVPPRPQRDQPLRVCMAGRLEPMKGFHLGIQAFARAGANRFDRLTIIGKGAEQERLERQAREAGLDNFHLLAPVGYPEPFFRFLDGYDVVLLTNLNDEQPRLIFDAISRGCIPVCPDTLPYRALGLDPRLLYRQGDVTALSERLVALSDPVLRQELSSAIADLATRFTLPAMHTARLEWMASVKERGG